MLRVFREGAPVDPKETRRPSVEAMLHAILLSIPEVQFIGHTHPVYTNSILCSVRAEDTFAWMYLP